MGVQPQQSQSAETSHHSETLPISFALVGVQKAATSTIAFYLLRHRHVSRGERKERHFFDKDFLDWENPDYSSYTSPRRTPRQKVAGDYTPAYLFWPQALQRMHRYNPDMLLIASFRDPIERAFSQWQMDYARHEAFPQFAQAIAQDTFETIPDRLPEGWQPGELRRRALATRGLYGAQLERAFEIYPDRSRWLLLDFLDVVTDRDGLLDMLTEFLGIGAVPGPARPAGQERQPRRRRPTADGRRHAAAGRAVRARPPALREALGHRHLPLGHLPHPRRHPRPRRARREARPQGRPAALIAWSGWFEVARGAASTGRRDPTVTCGRLDARPAGRSPRPVRRPPRSE